MLLKEIKRNYIVSYDNPEQLEKSIIFTGIGWYSYKTLKGLNSQGKPYGRYEKGTFATTSRIKIDKRDSRRFI